jgi:hypothetical protein
VPSTPYADYLFSYEPEPQPEEMNGDPTLAEPVLETYWNKCLRVFPRDPELWHVPYRMDCDDCRGTGTRINYLVVNNVYSERHVNVFCGCCEVDLVPETCEDRVCTYRLNPAFLKARYLQAIDEGYDERTAMLADVMEHVDELNMQSRQRVFYHNDDETIIGSECVGFSKKFGYRCSSLN